MNDMFPAIRRQNRSNGGLMGTRLTIGIVVLAVALMASRLPADAHHAFSAEFDAEKPIKFVGATVTKVSLINPHSWIYVDIMKPDGTVENWAIEAGSPNVLMRRGITRDTVKAGTKINVDGYQSKDGSRRANGRDLTLPDGTQLFLGSPGTGAPYEVQRP